MKWKPEEIGRFGFKVGRSLEPAWFTLWRDPEDYRLVLFYINEDEDVINTTTHVPFEYGDKIIEQAADNGHILEWDEDYNLPREQIGDDPFSWSFDIADPKGNTLFISHGMEGFPPTEYFAAVLAAIRTACPEFGSSMPELEQFS